MKNPVRNDVLYLRYQRAIELIKRLAVVPTVECSAYVDDPELPVSFHCVTLYVQGDFEDREQVKILTEIIECFDSFNISGCDDFRVNFTFMIEDIYTEK